jgi:hypothetical protein
MFNRWTSKSIHKKEKSKSVYDYFLKYLDRFGHEEFNIGVPNIHKLFLGFEKGRQLLDKNIPMCWNICNSDFKTILHFFPLNSVTFWGQITDIN